ncbi:hypothetical protein Tco_0409292 [Tanacetum coccineum]
MLHYMMIVIETGGHSREVHRISRAVRLTIAFNRKLKASVVSSFLSFALTPGSRSTFSISGIPSKGILLLGLVNNGCWNFVRFEYLCKYQTWKGQDDYLSKKA